MTAHQQVLKRVNIFDFNFTVYPTVEQTIEAIAAFDSTHLPAEKRPFLITPNVDDVVNWRKPAFKELRSEFVRSAFIVPDGQPLVTFSKLVGKSLKRRLTGSSLFPPLWEKVMATDKKAFFILANETLCKFYEDEYADARAYNPPFFTANDTEAINKIVADCKAIIEEQRPDFVFVGIQFPKQNVLALELYKTIQVDKMPLFLILGSSMEYYAGHLKRCPPFVQKIGMEWFYRMCQQPRRLFKRYIINDAPIVGIFVKELFR
jgi:N-acetylglucosaminyldiphosphoundecaprenol N-acetyl-beta-D-mannosaminyltransferase